jgi:hypothetical protein
MGIGVKVICGVEDECHMAVPRLERCRNLRNWLLDAQAASLAGRLGSKVTHLHFAFGVPVFKHLQMFVKVLAGD